MLGGGTYFGRPTPFYIYFIPVSCDFENDPEFVSIITIETEHMYTTSAHLLPLQSTVTKQ